MDETLLWIPITIAEILLLVSVALGFLLTRARKAERLLRTQLEAAERASKRPAAAPPLKEAPVAQQPRPEPVLTEYEALGTHRKLEKLLPAMEAPPVDRCIDDLQQRLDATSKCLERVAAELHKERTLSEHSQHELTDLRQNLGGLALELTTLRHANARLQQELRSKKDILDGAMLADRGSKEKILLYIKRLRDDLATLQLKLANSEADVQKLRQAKEVLAADYAILTKEYERIYANFRK